MRQKKLKCEELTNLAIKKVKKYSMLRILFFFTVKAISLRADFFTNAIT
jgi:hypothetical protein